MQITAAHYPWQKGRVEQRIATIKEVAGKTILQHQVAGWSATSVVSYEVAHALNQRGHTTSHTGFWAANEGLRRTDGTWRGCSSSGGGGRRRRVGTTFYHSGVRARSLGRTCRFRSDQESSGNVFPAHENILARYPL